jgi:creatinine amidohydrolase
MDESSIKSESLSDKSIFSDTMVELTWQEVKKEAERDSIVLFPISVIEEHGPHKDLSPDIYGANIICKLIKFKLAEKGINSIIAPPYYWGINKATGRFPGSFTVKPETFKALLFDTMECLKSWGFTKVFTLNLHGDSLHCSTLESSIKEIRNNLGIDAYNLFSLSKELIKNHQPFRPARSGKFSPDYHAGAVETALIRAYHPDKVNVEMAKKLKPQVSFDEPLGYVGDPANFELENEKEASIKIAEFYMQVIETFLKKQADIFRRTSPHGV